MSRQKKVEVRALAEVGSSRDWLEGEGNELSRRYVCTGGTCVLDFGEIQEYPSPQEVSLQ